MPQSNSNDYDRIEFIFRGVEVHVTGIFHDEFKGCDSMNPDFYDCGACGHIDDMRVFIGCWEVYELLSSEMVRDIEEEALKIYFRRG